jgi:putative ABC transport system permease protein
MGSVSKLTYEIALKIKEREKNFLKVSPELSSSASVRFRNKTKNSRISGVTSEYTVVRNSSVEMGRFIRKRDIFGKKRVAVIGKIIHQELFPTIDPIKKNITIKSSKFKVIGVMKEKGYLMNMNLDNQVFIPLTTAQNLFGTKKISAIYIQAPSSAEVKTAMLKTEKILKKSLDEDDFVLNTQAELLSTFESIMSILTIMLGAIAGISLVVGGIGIMNIMLVSVTERTREIGLRKAIGASERDITFQFLLEAVTLSIIGGVLGITIGFFGSFALHKFTILVPIVTFWSILVAFSFSALVGIFFGVYPAIKAGKLDPIVALRYE